MLGEIGCRAAVVLTAGLSTQKTPDGRTLQQAMLDAAKPYLLRGMVQWMEDNGLTPQILVDATLAGMNDWNQKTHGRSGLIDKVKASTMDEAAVEAAALEFLNKYSLPGHSPMCGNSIGQDRRFMVRYMPALEAFFHYRNLDVSTLKELCKRWQPEIYKGFKKKSRHTALADIQESIDELKYYREHFLKG